MLLDFPYLSRVAECVRCSTIFYVGAGETSVFGGSGKCHVVGWLQGLLDFLVLPELIGHGDLVNADKPQQVFLCRFFVSVLLN